MNRIHIKDPDAHLAGASRSRTLLVPDMRREDSLLWRLAELDIAPADIDYVINTHLHFDHAGNNDLLKDAKFFVQREHYEYAKDNPAFPNQYWNLPGLSYELVDGAATLFPGVEVIPTPGHAPAHQSVLLRLPETGNMIISGDAVYCQENYDHDAWGGQADPADGPGQRAGPARAGERENASMIYGHDRNQAKDPAVLDPVLRLACSPPSRSRAVPRRPAEGAASCLEHPVVIRNVRSIDGTGAAPVPGRP